MSPKGKPEYYGPRDYSDILKESESLGTLVGGMAVNIWADYYLERVPALEQFSPFLSRDADFVGGQAQALDVKQRLGWSIRTFRPEEAGSPVSAMLVAKDGRFVEILHSVIGLNRDEIERLSMKLTYGEFPIVLLTPPALLKTKLSNLARLDQKASDRQDLKQAQMLVPINKEFLVEVIDASHRGELKRRKVILYLNTVFEIITSREALPHRSLFGERGELIFPAEELKSSPTESFRNFYRHRIERRE